jgi:hypothetical protein
MTTTLSRAKPGNRFGQGLVGGIVGGILMAGLSMIVFPIIRAGGFFQPLNLIAAVHRPEWGTISGFALEPCVVGLMIHMIVSVLVGIFLCFIFWDATNRPLWLVIASLAVWAVAQYLILPAVDPVLVRTFPAWLFVLAYAVYGIGLGGYLASRNFTATNRRRRTQTPVD